MSASKRNFFIYLAVFMALLVALSSWLAPGSKLTEEEIADYIGRMDGGLVMDDGDKREFLARLKRWAEADDGQPVHMLNLIRFHESLGEIPGHSEFNGTPEEANAHYEKVVLPLLAPRGIYPVFASSTQGVDMDGDRVSNLFGFMPDLDRWDRVLLVRYPSRRAFFDMASDPAYLEVVPFKLAAIDLGFVPLDKVYQLPDPRWLVALLGLILFLGALSLRSKKA